MSTTESKSSSDWVPPPPPKERVPLSVADKSINYEAAAFTQHQKLNWITVDRINKFIHNKEWTDANLSDKRLYFDKCPPVTLEVYSPDPKKELRPLFKTVMQNAKWKETKVGESFGPSWASHWFKLILQPKESWDKDAELHLIWNSNCEATLWTENGKCLQGFAGGTDQIREEYMFDKTQKFPLTLYVEMACNNRFGCKKGDWSEFLAPPPTDCTYKLEKCSLGWFNRKAWDLMWDLRVIVDLQDKLEKDSPQKLQILRAANNILNHVDPLDSKTYAKGRELTAQIMYGINAVKNGDIADSKGDDDDDDEESKYDILNGGKHTIYAVGNCHIDTAWLWPYGETRRKIIRSWASQLRLMELYNNNVNGDNLEYHFTASQAQQYQWLSEDCPELFKRICDVSKNKKTFHIVGGTWVEMDGNIPSGEGFVRQFLYGQEFYLKHFGRRCQIFWLPDTFGYSGQLPQIIRQCNIKYFLTQKLSWNLINKFPHHSFIWEGIDGSSVLTHFPPADTYVAQCNIGDILRSRDNYKNKSCNNESLMLFGWGDGGGGPTTMHLERIKRYTANGGMKNIPKVKTAGPLEFFEKLSKSVNRLPRYVGELYFELHRGTYTTHALIKKGNRSCELLLQFIEFIYTILAIKTNGKTKYPKENIDKLWKLVLLNQFHDVLPGSSIELANIDARNIYDKVVIELTKLVTTGMTKFNQYLQEYCSSSNDNTINSKACIVNNRSWKRREIINIRNGDSSILSDDDKKLSQTTYDKQTLIMVECDSYSISPMKSLKSNDTVSIKQTESNVFIMENNLIYVEILANGVIDSLIHKATNKQVIKKDANSDNIGGNNFLLFEDKPLFWEAWDVEIYHLQKYESVSANNAKTANMKIIENGPLRCGVEYTLQISKESVLIQRIFIESENPAILFETDIDWKEKYKFLKIQFPLNIRSNVCNYDIQFGFLQRPTVMNNTEDIAKFEVVGHKFADLSEYDFGCALINDSKYGYSCFKNLLRLSLVRATKRPDANADIHRHFIRYSLLPHNDTLQKSNVIAYSQNYNQKLKYIENKINKFQLNGLSFFDVDTKQIILDTVKLAQDESNDVILRFYEAFGGRTECKITMKLNVKSANICSLLEDIGQEIKVTQVDEATCSIQLYLQPFEIKSVRLKL